MLRYVPSPGLPEKESYQSEIIPRLYLKLLPVQIILVIIGGINSIIDNAGSISQFTVWMK